MKCSTKFFFFLVLLISGNNSFAQTWVDSLDAYAREKYLPASHYKWDWQNASLLKVIVMEYELSPEAQKQIYFNYIKKAMDKNYGFANGKTPNAVASGLGMAFLYKTTGELKYLRKCEKIFQDYKNIRRTKEGGVSHLMLFTELWDDTGFMVGQFLLAMYEATNDEQYLDELVLQLRVHREKLRDEQWGLWRHGWDADTKNHLCLCSKPHWQTKDDRKSAEIWGRGNGWIVVTLSDILETLPRSNPHWIEFSEYLKEMIVHLPELQDAKTGHWFQLPVRKDDPNNFIESSGTAMFAYGIGAALRLGLVSGNNYSEAVDKAYYGLRMHSIVSKGNNYLTTKNICIGTCIGDKDYYLKRGVQQGRPFGLGSFIQFGLRYEMDKGMRADFGIKRTLPDASILKNLYPEMILVEGGEYEMGSDDKTRGGSPRHTVMLNSFYIGKYEVKQDLWQAVMGNNPSFFKCADCPVEEITLKDIDAFLVKLFQLTRKHFRLPTEAEWEYAASGGKFSKGYTYSGSNSVNEVAWFAENAENKTHPVGQKKPNEVGLHDMSGNAWEVCSDDFNLGFYKYSPKQNPRNTKKGMFRVARGGSWRSDEQRCRSKARNRFVPDHHKENGSIRLVLDK